MEESNDIMQMTVTETAMLLGNSYSSLIINRKPIKSFPSVMLWGPPGVGKSQSIRQIAEIIEKTTQKQVKITDVRLLLFNPVDLRGIPTANAEKTLAVWLRPQIFQMDASEEIINVLFLDEISAAPQSVQAAAYQITLDRTVGEHKLPDNCIVIAAGNRTTDRSVAFEMPKALSNRLCHIEIVSDSAAWLDWANESGIHPKIIAYIKTSPSRLMPPESDETENAFPTPRSWEMVSNILNNVNGEIDTVFPLIVGCIGKRNAIAFRSWCNVYAAIPDVERICKGESMAVPTRPNSIYALISSIIEYLKSESNETYLHNVLEYSKALQPEFRSTLYYGIAKIRAFSKIIKDLPEFQYLG